MPRYIKSKEITIMDKTFIKEQIELVEGYLEALKALEVLAGDEAGVKRGFKKKGADCRKISTVLGKSLVAFRKASVQSEK